MEWEGIALVLGMVTVLTSGVACVVLGRQIPCEVLKRDCLLFYYPACASLAKKIAEASQGNVELAEIKWG